MKAKVFILITSILCLWLSSIYCVANGEDIEEQDKILVIEVKGVINPIMSDYIIKSIDEAEQKGMDAVLLEIDTPGGLSESMRDIIIKIMNTPLPVVGFVYPEGARAASAGALIMLSCDVNAMVSISNIGAAHPVSIGKEIDKTMEKKIMNDMLAYIESIAKKRGRNVEISKKMITESISLSAEQAHKDSIIDYLANNRNELFTKIDSTEITKNKHTFQFHTKSPQFYFKKMNFVQKLLFHICNPNIAYILLILGIYGIIMEFRSPGIGFAGVFGGISLLLAFLALSHLPINTAALLLIIGGAILILLEAMVPSSGILGIGGVVAILLGSLMLIQSSEPAFRISFSIILGVVMFSTGFFFLLVTLVFKAQRKKVTTGREGLIGEIGYALTDLVPEGRVKVSGEDWGAITYDKQNISAGQKIEVIRLDKFKLIVRKRES